jgi:hypothetical protein
VRPAGRTIEGGFFLMKKPLGGIAPGYTYSDSALTSLSTSIAYSWNIQTMDSNGDFVQTTVNYQP